MNIRRSNINTQNIAFSGHNRTTDVKGKVVDRLYYLYDPNKYKCEVEIYKIIKDEKSGDFSVDEGSMKSISLQDQAFVDITQRDLRDFNDGFAYRFKLTDKNKPDNVSYAFDNGHVINIFEGKNADKYNVVLNNRAVINKNGAMQLIMPDGYYPGFVNGKYNQEARDKALNSVRTHANKLGGDFYGIIARLDKIANDEGVTKIVGTPFTKDMISSHLYWTENAYRVCPGLGGEEGFKQLQIELCKRGINWIADAALVNQGFGGVQVSETLRKGEDSETKKMFRANEKISLGILPDKCDFTRLKLINAPFILTQDGTYTDKNKNYDPKKPTYIQFYDERLASEEQVNSPDPYAMTTYAKNNTDNVYDITAHDDAVYPFPVEVDPEQLKRNVKNLISAKGTENLDMKNIENLKAIADFQNFDVQNKSAAGGLELWDGNVDIAKLNFISLFKDDERTKTFADDKRSDWSDSAKEIQARKVLAVRDYAINSGKYWTKLAADVQLKYTADTLGIQSQNAQDYINKVAEAVKKGELPKSALKIQPEEYESVLRGTHKSRRLDIADMRADGSGNDYTYEDYILRQAMDLPLETLPVATNLLGVLTSPYIAKKANVESELGVSRYDVYNEQNQNLPEKYSLVYEEMDDIYRNEISPIISDIFEDICSEDETKKLQTANGKVSAFGKFALAEMVPDITKYLLLKSLAPDANVEIKNGEFDFSGVNENEITIQSLGIPYRGLTSEEEAKVVVNTIKDRLSELPESEIDKLKEAVEFRMNNRSLSGYKVAEMIMDRTESGLGWRIDAAKDVAPIDAVRVQADSMTEAWQNVIDFWKRYNQAVLVENPHAYTTAEITDMGALIQPDEVYYSAGDAERKFLAETGITSIANYNFFFSPFPAMFMRSGWGGTYDRNVKDVLKNLSMGWNHNKKDTAGFLFQGMDDSVKYSYNFVGNHDKPRILHELALDPDQKNKAIQVAMGNRLKTAAGEKCKTPEQNDAVEKAIDQLVSGTFKGKLFDANSFGTRPFDVAIDTVFEQIKYNGDIDKFIGADNKSNVADIKKEMLKSVLEPAFDRFLSVYKTLVTLPGSPTDFAGDRVGNSGYETVSKNYYQQNRNVVHWEWLNEKVDDKKSTEEVDDKINNKPLKFVKEFYDELNKIAKMREIPQLSALNNGDSIAISVSDSIQGLLRYNDEGSCVLSFYNAVGNHSPLEEKMDRKSSEHLHARQVDKLYLHSDLSHLDFKELGLENDHVEELGNQDSGLKHGLKVGMTFYNARKLTDGDCLDEKYVVKKDNKGKYYLQKYEKSDAGWTLVPSEITPDDKNVLVLYADTSNLYTPKKTENK